MKYLAFLVLAITTSSVFAEIPLITVKGEAESSSTPDFVRVSASIYTTEKTVADAKSEVDAKAQKTFDALEGFKISDNDLTFGGLSVEREYDYDRNDNQKFVGYTVTRDIEVKLRSFQNYELLIESLIRAGATSVGSPQAGVDDEAALKTAALKEATAIAKRKAQEIAKGLDVSVGAPFEIGEDRLPSQSPFRQRRAARSQIEEVVVTAERRVQNLADYKPLPFVPDDIKVSATVWVSFQLVSGE